MDKTQTINSRYNEPSGPPNTPDHLRMAESMAESILDLDLLIQNEVIDSILNIVKTSRNMLHEEIRSKTAYLEESMKELTTILSLPQ